MILDYVEKLSLSKEEAKKQDYACQALARLATGLFWLNETVTQVEIDLRAKARVTDLQVSLAESLLDEKSWGQISSAFHWYSTSICNYAQLVGWLAYRDSQQAKDFLHKVLPNVSKYRNKVAAHFALSDPHKDDNEATVAASVISNIVYARGRLYTGAFSLTSIGGKEFEPTGIESWSITQVHHRISKRFWRNGKPKGHGALMIENEAPISMAINFKSPL